MSTHQSTASAARDPNHALNVRVLRFRHSPHREDPTLLAQELLDHGRHEDALELLDDALAREPGDADLELLRGRALLGAGDVSRAKETLIRAAKAAPGWAAPFTWLTRALSIGEGSSRIGAVAVRAKALGADDTQVVRIAVGHETAKRLDERLARFDVSPDREEPVMLARELALAARKDDATRVLRAALDRDHEDPDALTALAQLERADGRTDEAVALLRRARTAAPGWETVERALFSLVGVDVPLDEDAPEAAATLEAEHERASDRPSGTPAGINGPSGTPAVINAFDLEIAVEPLVTSAAEPDEDFYLRLAPRRDATVPYAIEPRDTEHGAPAVDATLVGMPVPARAPVSVSPPRPELAHGRLRRAGATGWPRRVVAKAEPVAAPYVRVLVGDARPRAARA
jgi:Flp pilus assembly protein TadD